jgi:uncharacterized protein DUF6350
VPAVPLLAALPQGPVQPWWVLALAVPLLVGGAVGRRCATAGHDLVEQLRVLAVAATVVGLGSAVLGALAGGRLGAAAFDPVEVPFGSLAVAVFAAMLLGGGAVMLLSVLAARTAPDTAGVINRVDDRNETADGREHPGEAGPTPLGRVGAPPSEADADPGGEVAR